MRRFFVLYLSALLTAPCIQAQLKHVTLRDGLAGLSVSDVREDPNGLLWIATSGGGVNLYNGHSLLTYHLPQTAEGLPNYCYQLALTPDGDVLAATKGGLYRLRRYGDAFQRVAGELDRAECVLAQGDAVYVGNRTGLFVVDGRGRVSSLETGVSKTESNKSVRHIVEGTDGRLWFTTRNGIGSIEPGGRRVTFFPLQIPSGLSKLAVQGQTVYVGTKNNGLYVLDTQTGRSHPLTGIGTLLPMCARVPTACCAWPPMGPEPLS